MPFPRKLLPVLPVNPVFVSKDVRDVLCCPVPRTLHPTENTRFVRFFRDFEKLACTTADYRGVTDQIFRKCGFYRWDEKAGLHGMRYAPRIDVLYAQEKETGDEED